jgi:hypothetical protein
VRKLARQVLAANSSCNWAGVSLEKYKTDNNKYKEKYKINNNKVKSYQKYNIYQ